MLRRLASLSLLALWALAAPFSAPAAIEDIARPERITIGDERPDGECIPYKAWHIQKPFGELWACSADALTYTPMFTTTPPGPGPGALPDVIELGPGVFPLDTHTKVWVTVGTAGASFTLPDATNPTHSRDVRLIIKDTGEGRMTLNALPGQTINRKSSGPTPPLGGQDSEYRAERMSNTEWRVTELSTVGFGADFLTEKRGRVTLRPGGRSCSVGSGDTNDSGSGAGTDLTHNNTCTIPAIGGPESTGTVMEGDVIHVYVGWEMTNGATQSTNCAIGLKIDNIKVFETEAWSTFTSLVTGGVAHYVIRVGADPGPSVPLTTQNVAGGGLWRESWIGNSIAQPVNIATNTAMVFKAFSKFGTAGSSDNEMTPLFMIVEIR